MGYTHYWKLNQDADDVAWARLKLAVHHLLRHDRSVPLDVGMSEDYVLVNGVEDESHEDFVLHKTRTSFSFCKTARKPYDTVVVAILYMARAYLPAFEFSSDGGESDLMAGKLLAEAIIKEVDNE